MRLHTFTANSAGEALATIRRELGPEAVVLNVRQLPSAGLSRLWKGSRIEVLACAPQTAAAVAPTHPLAEIREELQQLRRHLLERPSPDTASLPGAAPSPAASSYGWQIAELLSQHGVHPVCLEKLMQTIQTAHGAAAPTSLREEIAAFRSALLSLWPDSDPASLTPPGLHVFVGPAGSGKSTCLCQWLTQTVLLAAQPARLWRLDGSRANTAEQVSVYGEILGVPVDRSPLRDQPLDPNEVVFVDLPGIDWRDPIALEAVANQVHDLGPAQVHLVLNLAYDPALLIAQARAFQRLEMHDVILTHLDEEARWGKTLNLVLGTNCCVRFLSMGQNIPGDFVVASRDLILSRLFPSYQGA
jgi:flagellar biosynthesis protein FlhF